MKLASLRNLFFKVTKLLIDRKRKTNFMTKNTIFTQLTHFISPFKFQKISEKYGNEKYIKTFNGYTHFKILLLTQIKAFSSLRSIEIGLKSRASRLYHMGISIVLRRSTLSDANNNRNPKVLQDVFYQLAKISNEVNSIERMSAWLFHIARNKSSCFWEWIWY